MNCLHDRSISIEVVPYNPVVELDLKEGSSLSQDGFLLLCVPASWKLHLVTVLGVVVAPLWLDHNSRLFTLSHLLNRPPEAIRHLRVAENHLYRLMLLKKDLTLLNIVVLIPLAVHVDAWSFARRCYV